MVIDLASRIQQPLTRNLYKLAAPLVERGLAIRDFNDLCERTRRGYLEHADYPSARAWYNTAAKELGANYDADLPANFTMPTEGPLVIISNHPFGVLDPVILGDFISQYRPYVRFMTNFLLGEMEELKPWIIPVDPFATEQSAKRNLAPMKEALRFLRQGGALTIFPSGEVAHYKPGLGVEESPWSSHVGALVRRTQATVLPVYFDGQNSALFHAAGLLHPILRTTLLFRELFQRSRSKVHMRVGQPIPFSRLKKFDDDEGLTRYLRLHTFILSQRHRVVTKTKELSGDELASAVPVPALSSSTQVDFEGEIETLRSANAVLAKQGHLSAFVAAAPLIPHLLREIGRLREVTFREVGEGTGEDIDLDKFDDYYLHIFLWDEKERRIAGAYRLGRCDMIMRRYGASGLYTSTLFEFHKPFMQHLDDALEMGRSFIAPNYQRTLSALPLLWKAILTWVCRHPRYTKLFGPVSISQDYHGLSRKLIVEFLRDNNFDTDLAMLIRPRKPYHYGKNKKLLREFISAELRNVDDFSALISSLEDDGKGIPTLLKHYLRLSGTLLSFNVDKAFSSCLDGLILVDLRHAEARLLSKYMGEEACAEYLKHHGKVTGPA
ncbi:MAG: lysophospholipid acyltransferase family protein [Roseimicrobium sp.]